MAFIDKIKRFNQMRIEKTQQEPGEALTPSEVELNSFKERERLDNVKRELGIFRKKNTMLNDNQGLHGSILGQKQNLFSHDTFFKGSSNIKRNKKSSILSGGNSLFFGGSK